MKRWKWTQAILLTTSMLLCAVQANAALITIQISGHVTSASGIGLPDTIKAGEAFTGTYSYDSLTPNSDARPNRGVYQQDETYAINILLGGYEFKTTGGFSITIWNNFTSSLGTSYDFYGINGWGSALPDKQHCIIGWSLTDYNCQALSSNALPNEAPNLDDWTSNRIQLSNPNVFLINGLVTEATLIPEPTSLLLLGVGFSLIRAIRN